MSPQTAHCCGSFGGFAVEVAAAAVAAAADGRIGTEKETGGEGSALVVIETPPPPPRRPNGSPEDEDRDDDGVPGVVGDWAHEDGGLIADDPRGGGGDIVSKALKR